MVRGWDERDYKLWSAIQALPSYGLRGGETLIKIREVVEVMEQQARARAERKEDGREPKRL